jgi:hypothetical protein
LSLSMKVFRAVLGCSLVLVASGCGTRMPAAATRVLAPDSAALSRTPVCFVPPDPRLGLTERAQQGEIVGICEAAARSQGIRVVTTGSGQCLAATMSWAVRDTGDRSGACAGTWGAAECYSSAVRIKLLKLTLAQSTGRVLAETTASILSDRAEFTRENFHALCTAAFENFPQPLSNEQFEVPVD